MMPEISIIVPVYNVEKYLRKCIDSILAQTFAEFECILVDDGSTDSSPAICDEYAAKDNRIVVIHTVNRGLSAARNAGLDRADGAWIGFVDSDDWCDPGMFQFLYDNAVKHNADVSVCEYRPINEVPGEIGENGHAVKIKNRPEMFYDNRPDDAIADMFSDRAINFAVWIKLIKAKYIRRFQFRFDTAARHCEDMLFTYQLLKSVKRVFYSPEIHYNYLIRKNSEFHQPVLKKTGCIAVFDLMITSEQTKKLKRQILSCKVDFVSDICYLELENCRDARYNSFLCAAKKHIFIILSLSLPVKARLSRFFCVLSPAAFLFLRQKYRKIKRRPA